MNDKTELKMYTIHEVGEILGVSYRVALNLVRDGKLKAIRVGKNWKVSASNLDSYREQRSDVFTPHQAADLLGVSYRTVLREIQEGNLSASKYRNTYRITRDDLESYMNGDSKGQTPEATQSTLENTTAALQERNIS